VADTDAQIQVEVHPRDLDPIARNQVGNGMPDESAAEQLCRWEMFSSGEWHRCGKPRRHDGTHQIGTVIIGTRALIRLRMQRNPSVRRARTRPRK